MLRAVSDLTGYSIGATDGAIGEVEGLYFDDQRWTVRYLVVDTSGWLAGRRVLVSPWAIRGVDAANKSIAVALTRTQVENSPSVETQQPVDRRYEMEYSRYYGYPYYWTGPYLWGAEAYPLPLAGPASSPPRRTRRARGRSPSAQHRAVTGYYIQATDGDIGHVEDFLVEDRSWTIRYVVVDTRNWWPGKKVLVSPDWITRVDWYDSKVHVDLARDTIKNSPEYDPRSPWPASTRRVSTTRIAARHTGNGDVGRCRAAPARSGADPGLLEELLQHAAGDRAAIASGRADVIDGGDLAGQHGPRLSLIDLIRPPPAQVGRGPHGFEERWWPTLPSAMRTSSRRPSRQRASPAKQTLLIAWAWRVPTLR